MENMAPLRSSTSHGGSGDFLVCLSSDDSSHLVKHKQIQLVGRCKKRSNCAKRRDAEVIHFAVVDRDVLINTTLSFTEYLKLAHSANFVGRLDYGHAKF